MLPKFYVSNILEDNTLDASFLVNDSIVCLSNDFGDYSYPDKDSQAFRDQFLDKLSKMYSNQNVTLRIKYKSLFFFCFFCFFFLCVCVCIFWLYVCANKKVFFLKIKHNSLIKQSKKKTHTHTHTNK